MADVDLYTWTKPDGVRYHFRDDRLSWLYQRDGDIYISADPTSPAEIFGGEWERITGRFLFGTDTTENDPGTYPAGSTGGEATHTLTENEIPAHTHGEAGGHQHGFSLNAGAFYQNGSNRNGYNAYGATTAWFSTGWAGAHTHASVGGGQAHNNMPPYLAVYIWKRIA